MGIKKTKFWYVTDIERKKIEAFYKKHLHPEIKTGTIEIAPYHIEITPNSVSYTMKVVCDICEKKSVSKYPDIEWEEDITDYDSW